MADINDINAAQSVKIIGSDSNGLEQEPVNSVNGNLNVQPNFNIRNLDAYGRLQVSEPSVLFDIYFTDSSKDLLMTTFTANEGTVTRDAQTAESRVNTTTANGSRAVNQSKIYHHYVAGQAFEVLISGAFANPDANRVQRLGYFDDNNGMFFKYTNELAVVLRSSRTGSVDESVTITQSNFNLDKLDGTGPSGFNIDPTKFNLWAVSFQWQGTGNIRFGVYHQGLIVWCHHIQNENIITDPYMPRPSLPVRWEAENIGVTSSAGFLAVGCATVHTYGKANKASRNSTAGNDGDFNSINSTSWTPLCSIRLKAAFNRGQLIAKNFQVLSDSNKPVLYRLFLNPTLTGGTWVSIDAHTIAEQNTTATAITGGFPLFTIPSSGGASVDANLDSFLKVVSNYAGTPDILTIAARTFSTSGEAYGAINFEEISS